MATKEIFPKSRENLLMQQTALLIGAEGNFTRLDVMHDLQTMFNYCYEFGINPLPRIRKCFPVLEWEYFKLRQAQDMSAEIAKRADFVWRIYLGGYVVAIIKNKKTQVKTDVYFLHSGELAHGARDLFSIASVGWADDI